MRKSLIYIFVALTMLSLGLVLVPLGSCQTSNVKILSYTYYIDSYGLLNIVGEVQNTGPNALADVIVTGTVYASDGTVQANYFAQTGIEQHSMFYLNPGQKAPFYMTFFQPNNPQGGSWYEADVASFEIKVTNANTTQSYAYPDLSIISNTHTIGVNSEGTSVDLGVYWVSGNIENGGSQTAQNVAIFGTFYNTTGSVVAVGLWNYSGSLSPSTTMPFKFGAFDLNQSAVPSRLKIDHYSLQAYAYKPVLQGTAPIITPYETSSPTGSQTNSPQSSLTLIVVIVVIAVLAALGALLALRKRKPKETNEEEVNPNKVTPRRKVPRRLR
jgi:hypothetical protein